MCRRPFYSQWFHVYTSHFNDLMMRARLHYIYAYMYGGDSRLLISIIQIVSYAQFVEDNEPTCAPENIPK